jgi:hypothetical protein
MSNQTTTPRRSTLLLALTAGLLAALVLNLVVFDDLRTDASADVAGTFLAPQHLTSIVASLIAVILVAMGHRWAPRVALTVAWIEIVAFLFFHGLPFEIGPSKPYWGDGMGDGLQWLGLALILACSAAVVRTARPRASHAARPLAA